MKYSLFVGASSGAETENRWAELDMIERRSPHQVGKAIAKGINEGRINFFDKHLSMFPTDLLYVSWGERSLLVVLFAEYPRDSTRRTDQSATTASTW
jgi:acyl-CoA hydrolase